VFNTHSWCDFLCFYRSDVYGSRTVRYL